MNIVEVDVELPFKSSWMYIPAEVKILEENDEFYVIEILRPSGLKGLITKVPKYIIDELRIIPFEYIEQGIENKILIE